MTVNWKDPEEAKAYHRAYNKSYDKMYYDAHKDEKQIYRDVHKIEYNRKQRERYYQNYEKTLKSKRIERERLKHEVLGQYSTIGHPNCLHCGIDDIDVLTIDHIDNDGAEDRRTIGGGTDFYRRLRQQNYPKGYQVLCANCNLKKEILRRRNI